jgi:hypothetical protein
MKTFKKESALFKVLHVSALYAVVLQSFLPFGKAFAATHSQLNKHDFSGVLIANTAHSESPKQDAVTSIIPEVISEIERETSKPIVNAKLPSVVLGGPGQSESGGFSLNSNDGMVDPFTGDFTYSIPVMDVEGYPIVLSYNSNVGMTDEASWVGLGWNLNVGSVAREMRGIPDEFDGSQSISRVYNIKEGDVENGWKAGVTAGVMYRGNTNSRKSKLGLDFSLLYGTYKSPYSGTSRTFDFNIGASLAISGEGKRDDAFLGMRGGLGVSTDSKNGIGRSSSVGAIGSFGESDEATTFGSYGLSYGQNYHSRLGLTQRSIGANFSFGANSSYKQKQNDEIKTISGQYSFLPLSLGSSFTCGSITSVPQYEIASNYTSQNTVGDFSYAFSKGSKWMFTVGVEGQEYSSNQSLIYSNNSSKTINNPAFGYFHLRKRSNYTGSDRPVMDYNRERDIEFSEEMKNLPFSFPTYDVFYVNGMGMSATFRPQRNDIGIYNDGNTITPSDGNINNVSGGFVSKTTGTTLSITVGYVHGDDIGDARSGRWSGGQDQFSFGSDDKVYFKGIGEPTPKSDTLLNQVGGTEAAYLQIQDDENDLKINQTNTLYYDGGSKTLNATNLANANVSEVRANVYRPILATELENDTKLRTFRENQFIGPNPINDPFSHVDAIHKENHIAGVEVLATNGMRYEYGLPVYSVNESTVTFSTNSISANSQGLTPCVYIDPSNSSNTYREDRKENSSGGMNLYDKTTVPAYATAFLLTGVTSGDYIDLKEDGYSIDDIGDYYKINHTRVYDKDNSFSWRFPMGDNAFFNEGLLATDRDNTASYTMGDKEIWYTHSVESKNMIAEFTLVNRYDAYSVDANGNPITTKPLKQLHKITLYNRNERLTKGVNAKPLQVVEFKYDYSLCPNNPSTSGAPNGETGKLTLTEVRFYSGPKSEETALQPYRFTYATINPSFHYKNTDRWGNYKPDNAGRPLEYYPSAEQDIATANGNVTAWKLTKINLPSGSEMELEYEADSYRYVQNKRAMTLLDVKGYTNYIELAYLLKPAQTPWNESDNVSNELHKTMTSNQVANFAGIPNSAVNQLQNIAKAGLVNANFGVTADLAPIANLKQIPNNVVVFKLDKPLSGTKAQADIQFREKYLKEDSLAPEGSGYIKELYLKNFVQVKNEATRELIQTFAKIHQAPVNLILLNSNIIATTGVMPANASGEFNYGYIVLDNVYSTEGDNNPVAMNPVQKTALEFAKLHLTDIVYGSCPGCDSDLTIDRKAFWRGDIYKEMAKAGYCKTISTVYPSQVRLFDEDNKKIGGNARVAKVTMRDNWNTISNQGGQTESGTEYYWNYSYDEARSYGVAAYEPMTGNDENPYFKWERYTNKAVSFPDASKYTISPIGESLFPSPVVGYKTVTISLSGNKVIAANNLGVSMSSFCTAREYPTVTETTYLQKVDAKENSIFKKEVRLFGFSQGHSVITNDFHGKPLNYRVYNANGDLQARTTYYYKKPGEKVRMIAADGRLSDETIAAEYDVYADSRFTTSEVTTSLLGLSLSFPLAPTPSFIPNGVSPVISSSYRKVGFYTHTFSKHINYSAVVERIETESMGSVNTAQDLLYDRQTGAALLSSLTDEYNEPLYSFSYPAHWYYTLFRNPLEQPTAGITGNLVGGLFTAPSSLKDKLNVGDLVSISNGGSPVDAYVLTVNGAQAKLIQAVTSFGPVTQSGTQTITLKKSARKNLLSVMMQGVVTKRKPVLTSATFNFPTLDILEASAVTFRPRTNALCSRTDDGDKSIALPVSYSDIIFQLNPFAYGLLNNLVLEHSYVPQLERSSNQTQGIRYNGTYSGYFPYYAQNSAKEWVQIDEIGHPNLDATNLQNWRPLGQITTLDEYGRPLESRDQINVYSSILYGYNRFNKLIPVAQAVNAQQHEIAYDSFDDYTYFTAGSNYATGHFDFQNALSSNVTISNSQRHSGVSSLSVNNGSTASSTGSITKTTNCVEPPYSYSLGYFKVDSCMCVKPFAPVRGKDYFISLWVKGNAVNSTTGNYSDVTVTITYNGSVQTNTFPPTGQQIDGWQRIDGKFTIPSTATDITVSLKNTSAVDGAKAYFDDIRIHPFIAGMTTTVYDPETLLPMATHDGYNFTTYYGYDENLMPVRVRVETINGIQTISEAEGSTIKDFK